MSAQRVPAWKRLGLQLKGPASGEAIPGSGGSNAGPKPSSHVPSAHQSRVNGSPASALKRKLPSSTATSNAVSAHTPNKKPRTQDLTAANQNRGTPSSLTKSVSFADGTKKDKTDKKREKKVKKKANKTPDADKADTNLEPSLSYLRQWHTARESWKFNKNHQTLLIKYLFDGDKLHSSDITTFYQYIRDLKGGVRTRLRETAANIKKTDMEAGAGAFPASLKDKEAKQKEYEETISRFLQDLQQQQHHHHHHQPPSGTSKNANGKRALDEVEYVLRVATPEVKRRLLKRIRAEMVLGELSDSEESTDSATTGVSATATSTSSSSASSGQEAAGVSRAATTARQTDGSQQPAKRRRLRNVRTTIGDDGDDSSSSESESESGSGSETSSSESDESEDEEMDMGGNPAGESSSSSSSSSEDESESEAGGDSDEESGSESSSSGED